MCSAALSQCWTTALDTEYRVAHSGSSYNEGGSELFGVFKAEQVKLLNGKEYADSLNNVKELHGQRCWRRRSILHWQGLNAARWRSRGCTGTWRWVTAAGGRGACDRCRERLHCLVCILQQDQQGEVNLNRQYAKHQLAFCATDINKTESKPGIWLVYC